MKLFQALAVPLGLISSQSINILGNPEIQDLVVSTIDSVGGEILSQLDIEQPFSIVEGVYLAFNQYLNTGKFDYQLDNLLKIKFYNGFQFVDPVSKIDFGIKFFDPSVPDFGYQVADWNGYVSKTEKDSAKHGAVDSYKYITKSDIKFQAIIMLQKILNGNLITQWQMEKYGEMKELAVKNKAGYVLNLYSNPSRAKKYFTFESRGSSTRVRNLSHWDAERSLDFLPFEIGGEFDFRNNKLSMAIYEFVNNTYPEVDIFESVDDGIVLFSKLDNVHSPDYEPFYPLFKNSVNAVLGEVQYYLQRNVFYDDVETYSLAIALKNDKHGSKNIARIGDATNSNKKLQQHISKLPLTIRLEISKEQNIDQDYSRLLRIGRDQANPRVRRSPQEYIYNYDSSYDGYPDSYTYNYTDNDNYGNDIVVPEPSKLPISYDDYTSEVDTEYQPISMITEETTTETPSVHYDPSIVLQVRELKLEDFMPILEQTGVNPMNFFDEELEYFVKIDVEIASARYAEKVNDYSCHFNPISYINPTSLQDTCILNLFVNVQSGGNGGSLDRKRQKNSVDLRFKKGLLNYDSTDRVQELFKLTYKQDKAPKHALTFYNNFKDQAVSASLLDSNYYQLNFENFFNGTKQELPLVVLPSFTELMDISLQIRNKLLPLVNSAVTFVHKPQTIWYLDAILQYYDDNGLFDFSSLDGLLNVGVAIPICDSNKIEQFRRRNQLIDICDRESLRKFNEDFDFPYGYIDYANYPYDSEYYYHENIFRACDGEALSLLQMLVKTCEPLDQLDNWIPAGFDSDSKQFISLFFQGVSEGISEVINELVVEIETLRTQITQYIDFSEAIIESLKNENDEFNLETQPFKLQLGVSQNDTFNSQSHQGILVTLPTLNLNNLKFYLNHYLNDFGFFDWFFSVVDELNNSRIPYRNLHTMCMNDYDQCFDDMLDKIYEISESIYYCERGYWNIIPSIYQRSFCVR